VSDTPWMNAKETAEYMKVSERHLHKLKDTAGLPHGRTGKKLVFHRDDVDTFMRDKGKG
jgi:excisionase family DNA binding protein